MTLKLREGAYYRTRDGRKVGPLIGPDSEGEYTIAADLDSYIPLWREDGRNTFFPEYSSPEYDLVAEWPDEPPEPKRETVMLDLRYDEPDRRMPKRYWFAGCSESGATHCITFDLIDGEPDCTSIRMEKL